MHLEDTRKSTEKHWFELQAQEVLATYIEMFDTKSDVAVLKKWTMEYLL